MKLILYTALLFTFCFSKTSQAFDESLFFFDSEEIDYINNASLIDGEYYSDILAFRLSLRDHFNFVKAENGYDIAVGSISSKRFMTQQRLKLSHQISDALTFKAKYIERENFEISRSHFIVGLNYLINERWDVEFNTSLFSEKNENDLGFSTKYKLTLNHSLKLFFNFPDFSFNERVQENVENKKSTTNIGFKGSYNTDSNHLVEYYIFNNSRLKREFVDSGNIYELSEVRLGVNSILNYPSFKIGSLIESWNGEEGLYQNSNIEVWSRRGLRSLHQLYIQNWIFGVELNWRSWELNNEKVIHQNLMPHVWYKRNFKGLIDYIDFGLEASFHKSAGNFNLRKETDKNSDINSRFNMRIGFEFSKISFLNFLLSLDIDDGSWEGGGGQFQVLF